MRDGISACIRPNAPHHVILYNSDFSFTDFRDTCLLGNSVPKTVLSSEMMFFPYVFRIIRDIASLLYNEKELEMLSNVLLDYIL